MSLGNNLLFWLDELTPSNISKNFSESLQSMVNESDRNLLRVLHYPPIKGSAEKGAIRAAAHEDINLITLLVSGSQPGLEAMDRNKKWHKVPVDKGMITVNVGDFVNLQGSPNCVWEVLAVSSQSATEVIASISFVDNILIFAKG